MSADELKPRNCSSIRAYGLAGLCTDSVPLFDVPERNFGRTPWPSINEVTRDFCGDALGTDTLVKC